LPASLGEGTLYVNFAKMKINSACKVTGCIKNNYALLRAKNKAQYHGVLSAKLHDVNLAVRNLRMPLFCVVDGMIGMAILNSDGNPGLATMAKATSVSLEGPVLSVALELPIADVLTQIETMTSRKHGRK
jgi:hypothetical protein